MKLFDWLRPRRLENAATEAPTLPADEAKLAAKIARTNEGTPLSSEDWSTIDRLVARGREHEVVELLRHWIAAQPADLDATLRLCELLCGRLEHAAARPLLERLTREPAPTDRALILLGEAAERAGEPDFARRAYERVLARTLDHPRARAAADRLRPADRRGRGGAAPPTLDGPAQVTPIGDRYRLVDELGRGASGTVYLADDLELERQVALKILHPSTRGADRARLRAWGEACVSAQLRHPGIAAIYDLDEERQIIAMELCKGGSLRERLREGRLSTREALLVLQQLGSALGAAHERGIIHGDVKPANLLLRRKLDAERALLDEDELVLCDFGIARLADAGPAVEQRATQGTLVYMAPEQRRGQLDASADIFAAGIVALELVDDLGPYVSDRAALLRGDRRPDGSLSASALAALGEVGPVLQLLLRAMLRADPAARPRALDVASRAQALTRAHADSIE